MDKCQHGERIDRFCASECCVWREGAGCSNICMKKYHNHMGPSTLVPEKEVEVLLKKYKVENWVKPKVKTLEETIHNYFNYLKIELNNYIDEVDKKLRTELCYPYLSKYGIVGVYKKLKKREYKKVQQREFRQFYEQTINLRIEDFTREEKMLYQKQITQNSAILGDLFKSFNALEDSLKAIQVGVNFQVQKNFEQKIRLIFDSINSSKKDIYTGEDEIKEKFEDLSVGQTVGLQKHYSKEKLDKPLLNKWSSTGNTARKKSLDTINDSKNVESSLSLHKDLEKKNSRKSKEELDKMKNEIVSLMSNPKKDQSFGLTVTEPVENHREPTVHSDTSSKGDINDIKLLAKNKNYLTVDVKQVASSSIQSLALSEKEKFGSKIREKTDHSDITEIRHDVLPSHVANFPSEEKQKKKPSDLRLIVVPFKADKEIEPSELSPLMQKRKKFFENSKSETANQGTGLFDLLPVQEESPTKESPPRTPERPVKPQRSPEQQKSIQLLTDAIRSKGDDAVPLLKQALKIAPNNLSAAEYLSFLLLQSGNAKECFKVCNNIHQQLQDEMIYQSGLFHINNNRSVALLMLGRYSQAITGLQKTLSIGQNHLTYKNLGDAYYSIGIYEKAVYHYQKSISLKPSGQTYYNLAVCLFVQQNFHNSLIMAELAVKSSPEIPQYTTLVKQIKSNI